METMQRVSGEIIHRWARPSAEWDWRCMGDDVADGLDEYRYGAAARHDQTVALAARLIRAVGDDGTVLVMYGHQVSIELPRCQRAGALEASTLYVFTARRGRLASCVRL